MKDPAPTRTTLACALALVSTVSTGCTMGLDSVFFVTNTSVGADFESQPPAASFGYDRQEVVIAPAGKDGSALPVLATMGLDGGTFDLTADQSFATGAAAIIMADAFNTPGNYFDTSRDSTEKDAFRDSLDPASGGATEITASVSREPGTPSPEPDLTPRRLPPGAMLIEKDVDQRRCIIFGTNTAFGLQAKWLGEGTPLVPSSLNLGYKRKELAMVPLRTQYDGSYTYVEMASLLATIGLESEVKTVDGTTTRVTQTFATGDAATLLAAHQGIREKLGRSLLGEWDAEAFLDHVQRQTEILEALEEMAPGLDAAQLTRVGNRAVALGLIPEGGDYPDDLIDSANGEPDLTPDFEKLLAFANEVAGSTP